MPQTRLRQGPAERVLLATGAILLLGWVASCRAPSSTSSAPAPSAAPPPLEDAGAPADGASSAPGPPLSPPSVVERACARDEDCAVARVEATGPNACCPACGTTPGTRRWHAALQRYCGAHPPASCPPLACPLGPTVAVCRAGLGAAPAPAPAGGPAIGLPERRCLPAMVCTEWAGCVLVAGNAQDGWFVEQSERVARGEIAGVEQVCTGDAGCYETAKLFPSDVHCPPTTIPPILGPPPTGCALVAGRCTPKPGR